MFRNYFPLKEFDFTLAQVEVQFGSYFIHTICPSLVTISDPRVPLSFFLCSVPSSSVLYNAVVLWSGLDLPQHLKHGLSHMLYPERTNPFGSFLFNTSKSIAQILNFVILFLLQSRRPKLIFFFLKLGFFNPTDTLLPFSAQLPIILIINLRRWRESVVRLGRG